MTKNQIEYWKVQEQKRANIAAETENALSHRRQEAQKMADLEFNYANLRETNRANLAKETENTRSNIASETETHRANVARENETNRANVAKETETARSNKQQEKIKKWDLGLDSYLTWRGQNKRAAVDTLKVVADFIPTGD